MPQFNLIEVQLTNANTEQKFQEVSWNGKDGYVYKQSVPIPSDISCDYTIKLNVHGFHSVENLDKIFKAMKKAVNEMNQY